VSRGRGKAVVRHLQQELVHSAGHRRLLRGRVLVRLRLAAHVVAVVETERQRGHVHVPRVQAFHPARVPHAQQVAGLLHVRQQTHQPPRGFLVRVRHLGDFHHDLDELPEAQAHLTHTTEREREGGGAA